MSERPKPPRPAQGLAQKSPHKQARIDPALEARHRARRRVLQGLYEWDVAKHDARTVIANFQQEQDMTRVDVEYFATAMLAITTDIALIDDALKACVDRPLERVDVTERQILRIGTYELMHHMEMPYRVVINEAIEIAKEYGAEGGHSYVNGVLDKLAAKLRPAEYRHKQRD
jgi:transcription antitermination protein NusB